MSYLLGIDNGLTNTKAVVFDEDGEPVGTGSVPSQQLHPQPGWVEKDPDQQWQDATEAVKAALDESGIDAGEIAAIGLTGHGDGLYVLNGDGRPARPAITSLDGRAGEVLERFNREGVGERALPLVGEAPFGVQPAVMLAWVKEHEPEVYAEIGHVLFCKDWLKYRMTGAITTDPTEASAGFTDVHHQDYAPEALEIYGLQELEGAFPPIVGSAEIAGEVTDEAAEATGLAAGTPVVSGLHDCDASALGCGSARPGKLTMIAGTFSINEVISTDPVTDPAVLCRNWVEPGQWMNMGNSAASAVNLEWYVQQLAPEAVEAAKQSGDSPFAFVGREVAEALDDESRLVYLPFLYGSPANPEASAALVGLKGWHTRGHVLRALYEGVVFNHRMHVDALRQHFDVDEGRVTGGGARSEVWTQMFADALDLKISIAESDEAGALGAAICAGVGAGIYPSVAEGADRAVKVARTHEPDADRTERLHEGYEHYQQVIEALSPLWTR
ncbi:MAG: FGGY-family carbohydrate kinase [Egibacteraceae bacterium]